MTGRDSMPHGPSRDIDDTRTLGWPMPAHHEIVDGAGEITGRHRRPDARPDRAEFSDVRTYPGRWRRRLERAWTALAILMVVFLAGVATGWVGAR